MLRGGFLSRGVVRRVGHLRLFSSSSYRVLVVADYVDGRLSASTASMVRAAAAIDTKSDITVAVVGGGDLSSVSSAAARITGVSSVVTLTDSRLTARAVETVTPALRALIQERKYNAVIAAASAFGKNVMPRLAAVCDVEPVTDVVAIIDRTTFIRPIYAGNAMQTIRTPPHSLALLTIRPTAFDAAPSADSSCAIESYDASSSLSSSSALSAVVSEERALSNRADLSTARVVVSGGRGLKNADGFAMLTELANALGGAVGASRAAVDAGYVPNELQVGQTGKVVAPELYIAVGISGAIQHLAGMKDSKCIVAINKDREAPIFAVADYGLVADCFTAVPLLISLVKQAKA